jgi:hypothetical protein
MSGEKERLSSRGWFSFRGGLIAQSSFLAKDLAFWGLAFPPEFWVEPGCQVWLNPRRHGALANSIQSVEGALMAPLGGRSVICERRQQ